MLFCQDREFCSYFAELESSYFFIEDFWECGDAYGVFGGKELNLCKDLVGKRGGHDKAWVACGTAEVNESALSEKDDALAAWEDNVIYAWFDLFPGVGFERFNINFIIKMANITNNCLVLHGEHVGMGNDVLIAGCGDKDISMEDGFEADHFIAFHSGLERTDGVYFSDVDAC